MGSVECVFRPTKPLGRACGQEGAEQRAGPEAGGRRPTRPAIPRHPDPPAHPPPDEPAPGRRRRPGQDKDSRRWVWVHGGGGGGGPRPVHPLHDTRVSCRLLFSSCCFFRPFLRLTCPQRAASPRLDEKEEAIRNYSTFRPNSKNYEQKPDGRCRLAVVEGEVSSRYLDQPRTPT